MDLASIFIKDIPLIDVRAPIEFQQGAFPSATNLPLMDDHERHLVGICYKESGQQKAIELGHQLVSGEVKEARINAWHDFITQHPHALIYCFRGGLRSRISQQWLAEQHTSIELIQGGYKRLRRFMLEQLENLAKQPLIIIGGMTGCDKTGLIQSLGNALDLEGIANHRGSVFGQYVSPQPAQINFENHLACDFLKLKKEKNAPLVLEDEGRMIGKMLIPEALFNSMKQAPVIELIRDKEQRHINIFHDYIERGWDLHVEHYGVEAANYFYTYLRQSMDKIKRRLGGANHQKCIDLLIQAQISHQKNQNLAEHMNWIEFLLNNYYDPLYSYQLKQKSQRIVFRGKELEIRQWLKENS